MAELIFDRETYSYDQASRLLISLGMPSGDIRPAAREGMFLVFGGDAWAGYYLTGEGVERAAVDAYLYDRATMSRTAHAIPAIPAHVMATAETRETVENPQDLPMWSGEGAPPAIGSEVTNRNGDRCTITGYTVAGRAPGWLMAEGFVTTDPTKTGTLSGVEIRYPLA